MGNFDENRRAKEEIKKKNDTRREKLAGYFYDLSKLTFAGLVIGIIIPLFTNTDDKNNWYVITIGIVLTSLAALLANKIMK